MGHVEDDIGIFVNDLPASMQPRELLHLFQGAFHVAVFDDPAIVFKGMDGFQDGQQILCLIDAGEVEGIILFVVADGAGRYFGDEVVALIVPVSYIMMFVGEADRRLVSLPG